MAKSYHVTVHIRESYTVTVRANSRDEAIAKVRQGNYRPGMSDANGDRRWTKVEARLDPDA